MQRVASGKKALALIMMMAVAFAFWGAVMPGAALAKPVSGITIVNKTGGPISNLTHKSDDHTKSVFFASTLSNGASLTGYSNYDEWVFLWGTNASGKTITYCAEQKVSSGATIELYGEYNVKVYK